MHNSQSNIVFSGYWNIPYNPKVYRYKHLESLKHKKIDLLLCDKVHEGCLGENIQYHRLAFDNLPGHKYTVPLNESLLKHEKIFLKFCGPCPRDSYLNLACIWLSKIPLFKLVKSLYPDHEYYTWVDCIRSDNYNKIRNTNTYKIQVSEYSRSVRDRDPTQETTWHYRPFRNFLGEGCKHYHDHVVNHVLMAQVIKIPAQLIEQFIDIYDMVITEVMNNYVIFDEEIVLSVIYSMYEELFEIYPQQL